MGRVGLARAVVVDVDLELLLDQRIGERCRTHAHRDGPDRTEAEDSGEAAACGGGDRWRGVANTQARAGQRHRAVHHRRGAGEAMEHLQRRLDAGQGAVARRGQRGGGGGVEVLDEWKIGLSEGQRRQQGRRRAQGRQPARVSPSKPHRTLSAWGRATNSSCSVAPDEGKATAASP